MATCDFSALGCESYNDVDRVEMSPDGLPYLRSRFTLPIVPLDEVKSWDDDSDDGNMSPVGYAPVLNASGALAEARRAFGSLSVQHN